MQSPEIEETHVSSAKNDGNSSDKAKDTIGDGYSKDEGQRDAFNHIEYWKRQQERRALFAAQVIFATLISVFGASIFVYVYSGGFQVDDGVKSLIDQNINAILSLSPAFWGGIAGAITRCLMSGASLARHVGGLVGSGLIAVLAVLSFESGLVSIFLEAYFSERNAGELQAANITETVEIGGVYATIFVSMISGMFAFNLFYLMERVAEKTGSKN